MLTHRSHAVIRGRMAAAVRGCDPDFIRRDGGRAVDTHHLPILHTLPRSNLRAEGRPVRPPHLLLLLLLAHSSGCILICFSADCCSHRTSMIEEFERQNKDIMRYAWLIWFLSAGAQRLTTDCSSTVPVCFVYWLCRPKSGGLGAPQTIPYGHPICCSCFCLHTPPDAF